MNAPVPQPRFRLPQSLTIVAALLLVLPGCLRKSYVREKELTAFLRYSPQKKPIISANKGGDAYPGYPENCLETFSYVSRQMRSIIETDIATTKDSVLIIFNDDTFDRTTTGNGKVSEEKWALAKTFLLKDGHGKRTHYRIPTLKDLLKWGKGKVIFSLGIKKNVPYQRVIDAIQDAGAQNYTVIITDTPNQAALVHRLDHNLMIQVNILEIKDYDALRSAGVPDNRMVAFIGNKEAPDALYSFLHERGILTILGTAKNLDGMALSRGDEVYKKFVDNGADILSTTRPLQVGRILGLIR